MEASQRKLVQLQEHQANLVGMQLRVRERLTEARQAQQVLLAQENQASNVTSSSPAWENGNRPEQQLANDAEVLESETAALKGKLAALHHKKKQMDSLVSELQAVEMSDRASCSSENSRHTERDKAVELETLKQQLAHLKGLMEEATRVRDTFNPTVDTETVESNVNADCYDNGDTLDEEVVGAESSYNSFDRNSEVDDTYAKFSNSKERLTVEQINAVTRELKEQQALLQAARAELRRLKNGSTPPTTSATSSTPVLFLQGSTPPSSMLGAAAGDKKPSNNSSCTNIHMNGGEMPQGKKRQLEELVRKDQSHTSSVNRGSGAPEWGSRRGSNSQFSQTSTPANIWPIPNTNGL